MVWLLCLTIHLLTVALSKFIPSVHPFHKKKLGCNRLSSNPNYYCPCFCLTIHLQTVLPFRNRFLRYFLVLALPPTLFHSRVCALTTGYHVCVCSLPRHSNATSRHTATSHSECVCLSLPTLHFQLCLRVRYTSLLPRGISRDLVAGVQFSPPKIAKTVERKACFSLLGL